MWVSVCVKNKHPSNITENTLSNKNASHSGPVENAEQFRLLFGLAKLSVA